MRRYNSNMASSFTIVREANPEGIIFSNVGADVPVDKAVQSVQLLDAQALQVCTSRISHA